ncbi:hypothetical protein MS3_00009239 [Schistosoma haematobium]|uniref:Integrase catalytic domain-containing protein n=1 Tax=Schistosoma haematobium TaxID=6185 RepID=A0A922IJJ9_SCHHA|nr:hypothetical protein MS3_00009239 [Schistosoma haematobium]KAH9580655.1 hypothetical protein MS3_00009239 [Schistosoma haematobium]
MVVDSCIMFGDRIVIPKVLRHNVLKQFHSGINKMKSLARSYAYWPSCIQAAENPLKCEPHYWPETLMADNGSQFVAESFKHFCSVNGITHLRSSPYHSQSNGQAERFVDTFKRALLKGGGEGTTGQVITKFLTSYRATPNLNVPDSKSPAEAMFRRRIRTVFNAMLPSKLVNGHSQNPNIRSSNIGDEVFIKSYIEKNRWEPGEVVQKLGRVLYRVRGSFGTCIRHTNQIYEYKGTMQTRKNRPNFPLGLILDTPTLHMPKDTEKKPRTRQTTRIMGRRRSPVVKLP